MAFRDLRQMFRTGSSLRERTGQLDFSRPRGHEALLEGEVPAASGGYPDTRSHSGAFRLERRR